MAIIFAHRTPHGGVQLHGGVRIGATRAIVLGPGTVLAGYRIREVIGIGGMAIVYRAEQLALRRDVALKVLSPDLTQDDVFRERFRREAKLVAGLEHPNIVGIHDFGESEGRLFMAMRLIEGAPLSDRMRAGLTADDALGILRPVANALDAAHAAGLVHRDVKPQNILLAQTGRTYLVDFGVAKTLQQHSLTATGGFIGSLNYAAPEQIRGDRVTAAADVYALCALLFECMTGHVPYPRDTDASILHAHLSEPPPTVPPSWPHAAEFNALIGKGMAKSQSDRFATAGELLDAASALVGRMSAEERKVIPALGEPSVRPLAEEPAEPRPSAVAIPTVPRKRPAPAEDGEPTRRSGVRRRLLARLIAMAVVCIAAGTLVLMLHGGSGPRTARSTGSPTRTASAAQRKGTGVAVTRPGPDAVTARVIAKAGADIAIARENASATGDSRRSLTQRAQAASTLASVYDAEIKTLSSTPASARYRRSIPPFVAALRTDKDALKSFATAAQNKDNVSYQRAADSIYAAELALIKSAKNLRSALILIPPLQPLGTAPYPG